MIKSVIVLSCLVAIISCEAELKVEKLFVPEICANKSKNGDMLTMHYTGTLTNGNKFDSRASHKAVDLVKKEQATMFGTARTKCLKENNDGIQRRCEAYSGGGYSSDAQ